MIDIRGLEELNRSVLEKGLCAACGACVGRCPYLIKFKGKTIKLDSCTVEKGRCFAYCPMTFFDEKEISSELFNTSYDESGLGNIIEVLASRSTNEGIVLISQGGGTVTSFVEMALADNWIDAAVLTTRHSVDGYPRGIVLTSPTEVQSCAGSKFVGAHSLEALREALDKGYKKIGVVALPCQVRALRKMTLLDLKSEGLKEKINLVIGLFCNWAFSSRDLNLFLAQRFDTKTIKKFDIPPPPANVLSIHTDNGIDNIPLDEIRSLIQKACLQCPDMTSEFADVSVGMFEGRPGWNTLLVRSFQGKSLVDSAIQKGLVKVEPFPESNLAHLKEASIRKKQRGSTFNQTSVGS